MHVQEDKQYRGANTKNQFDKVRPLSDEEKAITLHSVDDLITNNFIWPMRGPGNGVYNPSDFGSAYVTVPMMTGIYGGSTSEEAPELCPSNTIPSDSGVTMAMKKDSLGYASNKYK